MALSRQCFFSCQNNNNNKCLHKYSDLLDSSVFLLNFIIFGPALRSRWGLMINVYSRQQLALDEPIVDQRGPYANEWQSYT